MTSSRPYLLRAFYEWIIDNELTPYLVLNADHPGVMVPKDYVENGRIVLNIAPHAIKDLMIQNEAVEFNARFAGVPHKIYASVRAVEAIYAKENGRGMVFKDEDEDDDGAPPPVTSGTKGGTKGSSGKSGRTGGGHLKVVK